MNPGTPNKPCSRCGEVKPLAGFNRASDAKDGRRSQCRECERVNRARYHQENREAHLKRSRRWREENREKMLERERRYHQENREARNEKSRRYKQENAEAVRAMNRRYQQENLDKCAANNALRRARKRNAVPPDECTDTLRYIDAGLRAGFRCHYCSAPADTVDHAAPICEGGHHAAYQLVAACGSCNGRKGRKPYHEFVAEIGGVREPLAFSRAIARSPATSWAWKPWPPAAVRAP